MPTPTEIFNKTLDRNTLERLQAEDAAALQIFRILDGTRAELYAKLRAFEDRIGEGAEARYSAIVLAQTIHEVNLTFAKMDATISPAFRAQLQAGYTQAQRQTYAEVAAFERDTPGFPEVFKPVAPTDAVLQFMDGQNATMTRLNDGLRARVVQELQRVQPNLSDAEALAAAGADATRIKEAISRGIVSGDGTLSIARRLAAPVDGEFPRLANNTVMRTVRLGINESFNHGHEEKIRESAKVVPGLGKAWVSALRRSTKICLDLHGQKCGVGDSFRVQGKDVARPPAIGAGLVPAFHLCRSRVVPWNPKWPPNPKLDELTTEEKDHFLNGGGKTAKQTGQGPKAIDGAKAALDERAKQLREKLDAAKAAKPKRGRPAGSKNKPKPTTQTPAHLQALGRIQAAKAAGNVPDLADVRILGRGMAESAETKAAAALPDLAQRRAQLVRDEARVAALLDKFINNKPAFTDDDATEYYALLGGNVKAQTELNLAIRPFYAAELKAIRPVGGVSLPISYPGRIKDRAKLRQGLGDAQKFYPREWLTQLAARGTLRAGIQPRGYYNDGSKEVMLSDGDSDYLTSVALHELGHGMEASIPYLMDLERAFYADRTAGEVGEYLPADPNSFCRKDNFITPYVGRDYSPMRDGKGFAYEIFTMGVESLFGTRRDVVEDPDHRDFILGVMAGL